jgi:hypothetical protein
MTTIPTNKDGHGHAKGDVKALTGQKRTAEDHINGRDSKSVRADVDINLFEENEVRYFIRLAAADDGKPRERTLMAEKPSPPETFTRGDVMQACRSVKLFSRLKSSLEAPDPWYIPTLREDVIATLDGDKAQVLPRTKKKTLKNWLALHAPNFYWLDENAMDCNTTKLSFINSPLEEEIDDPTLRLHGQLMASTRQAAKRSPNYDASKKIASNLEAIVELQKSWVEAAERASSLANEITMGLPVAQSSREQASAQAEALIDSNIELDCHFLDVDEHCQILQDDEDELSA